MTMRPADPNSIRFKPETQEVIRALMRLGYTVFNESGGVNRWRVDRSGEPRKLYTSIAEMAKLLDVTL